MSRRIALLIGNHTYQDENLSQFKTPEADVQDLASVLRDPAIGDFSVAETVINQPAREVRRRICDLYNWKKRYDVLLLYFSGLVVLDRTGQLYLATVDTIYDSLEKTAIPAAYITACMDRSFSRQQILILDCYHLGGAFTTSVTWALGSRPSIAAAFEGRGYGRVILTASDAIQSGLAKDKVLEKAAGFDFTKYLIQGLQTGAADTDEDGQIGVRELYEYVNMQGARPAAHVNQQPRLWSYGKRDSFIIAWNPNKVEQERSIKWDLIFGAIMAPIATVVIGAGASLSTSVGMAGLFLLLYALLYWVLD